MTSPGSIGAVVVDTARPHMELDELDPFLSASEDVNNRRQQLIMHLLQKVCGFLDPTPRLFLQNFRRMYDAGILTDLNLLSEMTLDPSVGRSLAKLRNTRPPQRKVGFHQVPPLRGNMSSLVPTNRGRPVPRALCESPPSLLRELDVSRSRTDFGHFSRVGKGGFGTVYKARHNMDGVYYAIKKVQFWHTGQAGLLERKVLREVRCLAKLDSPYVCRYYGAWFEAVWNKKTEDELERSSSDSMSQGPHEAFSSSDLSHLDDSVRSVLDESVRSIRSTRCLTLDGEDADDSMHSVHSERFNPNEQSESTSESTSESGQSDSESDAAPPPASRPMSIPSKAISIPKPKKNSSRVLDGLLFGDEELYQDFSPPRKEIEQKNPPRKNSGKNKQLRPRESLINFPPENAAWPGNRKGTALADHFSPFAPMALDNPNNKPSDLSPTAKAILEDDLYLESKTLHRLDSKLLSPSRTASPDDWTQISDRMRYKICLYIQSQFCDGETLRHWMTQRQQVDPGQCMRLFYQMVCGLHHVHCAGVIHRDLSPSNMFLTTNRDGEMQIKIGDFGLAREEVQQSDSSYKPRRPLGTHTYAAPEQLEGSFYCDRADIYSLGMVLFELLNAFDTGMERAKQMSLVRKGVLPEWFEQQYPSETRLIRWMTSLKPEMRPSTEALLMDAHVLGFAPRGVSSPPVPPPEQLEFTASAPVTLVGDKRDPLSVLQALQKSNSSPNLLLRRLEPRACSDNFQPGSPQRRAHSAERRGRSATCNPVKSASGEYRRMSREELISTLTSLSEMVEEQQGRITLLCSYIAGLQSTQRESPIHMIQKHERVVNFNPRNNINNPLVMQPLHSQTSNTTPA